MKNILKERVQIAKFLIVGLSGIFVNMFFLWFFVSIFKINLAIAGILAIEISVITNFMLNNLWTFRNNSKKTKPSVKFLKYNLAVLLGIGLNYAILISLTQIFGLFYLLSNLIGICCSTLSNYILSSRWAWKD